MNPDMEYFGRNFRIETDIKMGISNWAELDEHDLSHHEELRAAIDGYKEATGRLANGVPGVLPGHGAA